MRHMLAFAFSLLATGASAQVSVQAPPCPTSAGAPYTCDSTKKGRCYTDSTASNLPYHCNGTAWTTFGGASGLTVGTTAITSGGAKRLLLDSGGTLQETTAPTTADANADVVVGASAAGKKALVIQAGSATPTQPPFQVQGSNGVSWFQVQTDGGVIVDQRTGATYVSPLDVKYQGSSKFTVGTAGASVLGDLTLNTNTLISFSGQNYLGGATATLRLGAANAASPVGQTLTAQGSRPGTDSNVAGGSLTLACGLGTGNSVPCATVIQAPSMSATSGTATQVQRHRLGTATKVLTNNSAIAVISAAQASNSLIGGNLDYCIEVTDGTDQQTECGHVTWQGADKVGVQTNSATESDSTQAVTGGTLATTWAISAANPALISINANSSLTPSTGYPRITYTYSNLAAQAITIQ